MSNDCLMHYGVLGQKWGVRRYQNYDGTLKKHLGSAGKQAGNQFKNQMVQRTAQKVVNKAAGVDKKKESAGDIAKTILKGAAIAAATTALSSLMLNVSNDALSAGSSFVKNTLSDITFRDLVDMAIANHYGVL